MVGEFTPGVGNGFTVRITISVAGLQGPVASVVSVRVIIPVNDDGGVKVAFNVVFDGLYVPPTGNSVQIPLVAEPPIDPFRLILPPLHICISLPAFAVGAVSTVKFVVTDVEPHSFETVKVIV